MVYIISKETFGEYNVHDIQSNSCWNGCAIDGYALIPEPFVDIILATQGYCDLVLNDDGTEVVSFTPREIPEVPTECCVPPEIKVNPNLLDNWDFRNPVPLNGATGAYALGGGWFIDRWYCEFSNAITAEFNSNGLALGLFDPTGALPYVIQMNEFGRLAGQTVTVSVLTASGFSGSVELLYGMEATPAMSMFLTTIQSQEITSELTTFTAVVPNPLPFTGVGIRINGAGTIIAAKMEIGTVQTLAHQDNGLWVLNGISNYGEEVAKCNFASVVHGGKGVIFKDYIVDEGTSNGWRYRRWSNGWKECWKEVTATMAVLYSYGSSGNAWYSGDNTMTGGNYPFTFTAGSSINIQYSSGAGDGDNGYWFIPVNNGTYAKSPDFKALAFYGVSGVPLKLCLYVCGK